MCSSDLDIPHFPSPLLIAPGEAAFGEEEQMPVFETQQSASLVQPFQLSEGYGIICPLAFSKNGISLMVMLLFVISLTHVCDTTRF